MKTTRWVAAFAVMGLLLTGLVGLVGSPAGATGSQGCTPGYWKNHQDSWAASGYSPGAAVDSVFTGANPRFPHLGDATLLEALSFKGGPGTPGAAQILLRAAVAGLLNISNSSIDYGGVKATFINRTNTALKSGTRDQMLKLATEFDTRNNQGNCPLN
jgi:hypothetical protein